MRDFLHHKIFITSFIAALLLGFLAWSFLRLNRGADELRAKLNDIQIKVLFNEQERKAIRLAQSTKDEYKSDLERISKIFVKKDQPIGLVEDLEGLAKASGNLFVIDLDENKSAEGKNLFFRVAVDGTQTSVIRYLKALELMPYKISVREMVFQKIDSEKATHRLSLLISVETL